MNDDQKAAWPFPIGRKADDPSTTSDGTPPTIGVRPEAPDVAVHGSAEGPGDSPELLALVPAGKFGLWKDAAGQLYRVEPV